MIPAKYAFSKIGFRRETLPEWTSDQMVLISGVAVKNSKRRPEDQRSGKGTGCGDLIPYHHIRGSMFCYHQYGYQEGGGSGALVFAVNDYGMHNKNDKSFVFFITHTPSIDD